MRRGGGDFNAGQRVFRRLRRSGLQKVAPRACVHALSGLHPDMRLLLQFVESLRDRILAANLIESEELDALINTMDGIVSTRIEHSCVYLGAMFAAYLVALVLIARAYKA